MKKFYIVANEHRDPGLSFTQRLINHIEDCGGICKCYVSTKANWKDKHLEQIVSNNIDADCVIALGGDGTFVRAARVFAGSDIPIIGVNLGTLGYLCELTKKDAFNAIDMLLEDKYNLENRMLITGRMASVNEERNGTEKRVSALNDIVIQRAGNAQMINIELIVNGKYLTTYSGDGLIISTPTGSTGYSMSAGGPIVDPKADLILITPINPHTMYSRSIVVGSDAKIEVKLTEGHLERDEKAAVLFDGDEVFRLSVGESISVAKSNEYAGILKLDTLSFLQILRQKMQGDR